MYTRDVFYWISNTRRFRYYFSGSGPARPVNRAVGSIIQTPIDRRRRGCVNRVDYRWRWWGAEMDVGTHHVMT